jgi:hypothetical protein
LVTIPTLFRNSQQCELPTEVGIFSLRSRLGSSAG